MFFCFTLPFKSFFSLSQQRGRGDEGGKGRREGGGEGREGRRDRSLILSFEGSLEYLKFPLLKFNFSILVTYFPKYFRAKFREILTSGTREIGVFPIVMPLSIAVF